MDDLTARSRSGVVLLVDDDDDNREMYAEYLTFTGYDVVVTRNGEEGIAAAQAHLPDLILLDLRMPGVSGQQMIVCLSQSRTWGERGSYGRGSLEASGLG